MKFANSCVFTLLCCFALAIPQNANAGFINSGTMQSRALNINTGGALENNGELIGTVSADIICDTFIGKGLLQSPFVTIRTKTFAYKGTIDCSTKCTIITESPFNENMFKRKGGGEFVIVVSSNTDQNTAANPKDLESFEYVIVAD